MKKTGHMRQNTRVVRHASHRGAGPIVHGRRSKFLGKFLPAVPGVPPMLHEIREKFNIPFVLPGDNIQDQIAPGEEIDWKAVRLEIETRLRAMPEMLPKELAGFQKMIEFQKKMPRRPGFTESISNKLRLSVLQLYRGFKQLYDLTVDGLAVPCQKAVDGFISDAADNLCEFLRTGIAREVPKAWISVVKSVDLVGEKMVLVMASGLSDPDEVAQEFKEEFHKQFKRGGSKITGNSIEIADYLRMRLEKVKFKDIVDEYIQQHRKQYPPDEKSEEFQHARETVADTLKHSLRATEDRLSALIGE